MMDNMVKAMNAGYVLVALEKFIPQFAGTPLETMATNALNAQTNYIINNLKDPNGGFYNMYTVGTGANTSAKTLIANAAIVRGLYAAYAATNNNTYLTEANSGYDYIINTFYVASSGVFKTVEGSMNATYTPKNLGILAGLLREANLIGGKVNAKSIYATVFENIYNKTILREAEATGETGNDSDTDGIPYIVGGTKPFVFAAEATLAIPASVGSENLTEISIYPNPAINIISISQDTTVNTFKIINIIGQTVLQGDVLNNQINISKLNKGIYLVKLKNNDKQFISRFIKK